jgi:predicted small secreted protein
MKRIVALVTPAAAFAVLVGRNAVRGFGEDMRDLGHSISNAARQAAKSAAK